MMGFVQSSLLCVLLLTVGVTSAWAALGFDDPVAINPDANVQPTGDDSAPLAATDGEGNWIAVWSSEDDPNGSLGDDWDLFVSRSTDDGSTWSPFEILNPRATQDSGSDVASWLGSTASGEWTLIWLTNDDQGGRIGTDWDFMISRSTDNGATWSSQVLFGDVAATDPSHDANLDVLVGADGSLFAAWESTYTFDNTIGIDRDLLITRSTDHGATWSSPEILNTNAADDLQDDFNISLARDGNGNWVAVWQSTDPLNDTIGWDHDILVSRSSDSGISWTPPAPLNRNASTDEGTDDSPEVATDGYGNWIAVWGSNERLEEPDQNTEFDILFAVSTDNGATWASPEFLNSGALMDVAADYYPTITAVGSGEWSVMWHSWFDENDPLGRDWDLLISHSTDNGTTWSLSAPLNSNAATDAGDDRSLHLIMGESGEGMAVWESNDLLSGQVGDDYDIFYVQTVDHGGHWSFPKPLNSNTGHALTYNANPSVATDDTGLWVTAWSSTHRHLLRAELMISRSTDNGATWPSPEVLVQNTATIPTLDQYPLIRTDGDGTWIILFERKQHPDGPPNWNTDILMSRSTDHTATWSSPEVLSSNAGSDIEWERLTDLETDGLGNWVALWNSVVEGIPGGWFKLYTANSTDNGASWSPPMILTEGPNRLTDARLATDGQGLWITVWDSDDTLDGAIGSDSDILHSRSIDNGASWSSSQALNTDAPQDRWHDISADVTSNGGHNWVVTWQRSPDSDLAVSHSSDSGATWSPPEIVAENLWYGTPQVTTDGQGHWIAHWVMNILENPTDYETSIFLSHSMNNGVTWGAPSDHDTEELLASPHLATDGQGHWILVWEYDRIHDPSTGNILYRSDILVSTSDSVSFEHTGLFFH